MPSNFNRLLQSFKNNVGGVALIEFVARARSKEEYLDRLVAEANVRNLLIDHDLKQEVYMHLLDAFYNSQLPENQRWLVLLAVCKFDDLWEQLQKIDQFHQARQKTTDTTDTTVHEDRDLYGDFNPLVNIFTVESHLYLTESSAEYDYQIEPQPAGRLSSAATALHLIDEATVDVKGARINITPRPEIESLVIVVESAEISKDMVKLANSEEELSAAEIETNGNTTLITFRPVDFSRRSALLLKL